MEVATSFPRTSKSTGVQHIWANKTLGEMAREWVAPSRTSSRTQSPGMATYTRGIRIFFMKTSLPVWDLTSLGSQDVTKLEQLRDSEKSEGQWHYGAGTMITNRDLSFLVVKVRLPNPLPHLLNPLHRYYGPHTVSGFVFLTVQGK